jgi:hypothetical protein
VAVISIGERDVDGAGPGRWYDARLPGFGLYVSPDRATRSYFVEYRPRGAGRAGSKRRLTFARHGGPRFDGSAWTADLARDEALRLLGSVKAGIDPRALAGFDRARARAGVRASRPIDVLGEVMRREREDPTDQERLRERKLELAERTPPDPGARENQERQDTFLRGLFADRRLEGLAPAPPPDAVPAIMRGLEEELTGHHERVLLAFAEGLGLERTLGLLVGRFGASSVRDKLRACLRRSSRRADHLQRHVVRVALARYCRERGPPSDRGVAAVIGKVFGIPSEGVRSAIREARRAVGQDEALLRQIEDLCQAWARLHPPGRELEEFLRARAREWGEKRPF